MCSYDVLVVPNDSCEIFDLTRWLVIITCIQGYAIYIVTLHNTWVAMDHHKTSLANGILLPNIDMFVVVINDDSH